MWFCLVGLVLPGPGSGIPTRKRDQRKRPRREGDHFSIVLMHGGRTRTFVGITDAELRELLAIGWYRQIETHRG